MELLNATKMAAGYTAGVDKHAREYLLVVVKGTFLLPHGGSLPVLASEQSPLIAADQFTGEAGFSATLYESDYALFKPRCDVLVNGTAYAPGGSPKTSIPVGLQVASVNKVFNVVGDRRWEWRLGGVGTTPPDPFATKPLSYDFAFGGVDNFHPDPNLRDAYLPNPVGRGFHRFLEKELIEGTPLPNTEETARAVCHPQLPYLPMALGPMGRSWPDRAKHAGSYDQHWLDNVFPFLPADFDDRYHQAAPVDQQCNYLQGGENVRLFNLTPGGYLEFAVPAVSVPVVFFHRHGSAVQAQAVADTLMIEPDKGSFTITWRTQLPLQRNLFEISQVLVGEKSKGWWRARTAGKAYHASLASLVTPGAGIDE